MSKIRKLGSSLAVVATIGTSLAVGAGSANASVWNCGGQFDYCTTVVYDTGVHVGPTEGIRYIASAGSVYYLNCYGWGSSGEIWYNGHVPGWANGWIVGDAVATGHDPNEHIGPCH